MKLNIEIDCTPDEARRFLGLPDVAPMQELLLKAMQERLAEVIASTDPKALMDQWVPMGFKAMEQWPQLWAQIAATAASLPTAMAKAPARKG
jgi:hypothetical protein